MFKRYPTHLVWYEINQNIERATTSDLFNSSVEDKCDNLRTAIIIIELGTAYGVVVGDAVKAKRRGYQVRGKLLVISMGGPRTSSSSCDQTLHILPDNIKFNLFYLINHYIIL